MTLGYKAWVKVRIIAPLSTSTRFIHKDHNMIVLHTTFGDITRVAFVTTTRQHRSDLLLEEGDIIIVCALTEPTHRKTRDKHDSM